MIPCVISDALAFVCSSPYTAHHFTVEDDVGMRTRVEPMFGHAPFVLFCCSWLRLVPQEIPSFGDCHP
jgi:hypothetical protein